MSGGRWILVAVLTAALCGLLYMLAGGAGPADPTLGPAGGAGAARAPAAAAVALDRSDRPADAETLSTIEPSSDAVANAGTNERRDLAADEAQTESAQPATATFEPVEDTRPYVLRGLVQGPDQVDGGETSLRASLRHEPESDEATANATPDGRFEIDVTQLLDRAEQLQHPTELVVLADHPDFLPNQGSLPATRQVFAIDRDGEAYVASLGVTLERPYTMLHGRALGLGEIHVALMWPPQRRRQVPMLVDQRLARGGTFQLRVPFDGAYTVLAVAEKGQPAWVDVRVEERGAMSLEPLRIQHGRSVEGRIELPPTLDGEGSTLVVEPDWLVQIREAQRLRYRRLLDWHNVTWSREGGYELRKVTTEAGVQGRFRIESLAPKSYRVLLEDTHGFPPGNPYLGHLLTAGESDMRLVPHIARIVYKVSARKAGARPGARVSLSGHGSAPGVEPEYVGTTDSRGSVALVVPASLDSTLEVQSTGYTPVTRSMKTPLPGRDVHLEVHLELLTNASLVVRVVAAAGAAVPESVQLQVDYEGEPTLVRTIPVRDGAAVLEGLHAGKAEVRVRTTADPAVELDHFLASFLAGQRTVR